MATHQHKRPYAGSQPSITSYFPHSVSPTSSYQQNYSISPFPQVQSDRPQLSASIQSNLLSVGMRVRKSVPEGYKTGTYSAFTLFSGPSPKPPIQTSSTRNRPAAMELTPFCGILKVGGMAQQPCGIYNWGGDPGEATDEDEEYDVPTTSSGSIATPGERKRPMEFDDETPQAHNVLRERMNTVGVGGRTIAVSRRKKVRVKVGGVIILGQENADVDFDFGEADFLDYRLMEDSDMGGV